MLHCDNEGEKNAGKRKRKEISVIPLENPTKVVLGQWWDEQRNGGLVLAKHAVKDENNSVDWSEKIVMDAAGTSGEVHCSAVVFSVSVESMAGIFFRSNVSRSLYCLYYRFAQILTKLLTPPAYSLHSEICCAQCSAYASLSGSYIWNHF